MTHPDGNARPPARKRFEIDFNGPGNLRHAHSQAPYVIISKNIYQHIKPDGGSDDFSVFTLGLYTFIRMLPPGWEFTMRGLTKVLPHGRDRLTKEISILEKYGYLIRVQAKSENGKFGSDFMWVTVDDNADYEDVAEYLTDLGYYVYEKAVKERRTEKSQVRTDALIFRASDVTRQNATSAETVQMQDEISDVENPEAKSQVSTDALKTGASDVTRENAENVGNTQQDDVENLKSPGETDSLKNRLPVFETESNNGIKATTEDNLACGTAPAQARRAEPKGSPRPTRCQPDNSTRDDNQVGTGDSHTPLIAEPPAINDTHDTAKAQPPEPASIPLPSSEAQSPEEKRDPEIEAILSILKSSPNRDGLEDQAEKSRIWRAYKALLASGHEPADIEAAWWDDIRLHFNRRTEPDEYPRVSEWLEAWDGQTDGE